MYKNIVILILTLILIGGCSFLPYSKNIKQIYIQKLSVSQNPISDDCFFDEGGPYVGITNFDRFFLLDKISGKIVWKQAGKSNFIGRLSPTGKTVALASFDQDRQRGEVSVFDETGKTLWNKPIDIPEEVNFSDDGQIIAIKSGIETLSDISLYSLKGSFLTDSFSMHKNYDLFLSIPWFISSGDLILYEVDNHEHLQCIRMKKQKLWGILKTFDTKKSSFHFDFGPVFSNKNPDLFFFHLYDVKNAIALLLAFDLNGNLQWEKTISLRSDDNIFQIPFSISADQTNNYLIMNDWINNSLILLDVKNGKEIWRHPMSNEVQGNVELSSSGKWFILFLNEATQANNNNDLANANQANNLFIYSIKGQIIYQDKLGKNIVQAQFSQDEKSLYVLDEDTFYAYDISGILK